MTSSTLAGPRITVVRQGILRRRRDPRHVRLTTAVAAAYASPAYPLASLDDLLVEDITYGTSRRTTVEGTGLPVLRMNNLTPDGWDITDLKYLEAPDPALNGLLLRRGDLVVNRSNALPQVGKAAVFDLEGDWLFASFLLRLRLDTTRAIPDFVALFLNSPAGRLQIERLARPILGMANISPTEIRSIRVPLPDIAEQRLLLSPLRLAINRKNAKRRASAAELVGINDDIARLIGALPDTPRSPVFAVRAGDLRRSGRMAVQFMHPERAATIRGLMTMPGITAQRLDAVTDFIDLRSDGTGSLTVLGLASIEQHTGQVLPVSDDPATGRLFEAGDVLISRLRPRLNKVAAMTFAGRCSPEFYVLRPHDGLDPDYLAAVLRSPLVLRQLVHMTTGSTHPRVVEADARGLVVPVAPTAVQRQIARLMRAREIKAARLRTEAERDLQTALDAFDRALLS
jgi:hypothetical protein